MLPRDVAINTAMIKISVQLTATSNYNYTTDKRATIPYFASITLRTLCVTSVTADAVHADKPIDEETS
jgi:hypothetical protein